MVPDYCCRHVRRGARSDTDLRARLDYKGRSPSRGTRHQKRGPEDSQGERKGGALRGVGGGHMGTLSSQTRRDLWQPPRTNSASGLSAPGGGVELPESGSCKEMETSGVKTHVTGA